MIRPTAHTESLYGTGPEYGAYVTWGKFFRGVCFLWGDTGYFLGVHLLPDKSHGYHGD